MCEQSCYQRRSDLPEQSTAPCGAHVGVKAKLRTLPLMNYFPMIQRYEASIYIAGLGRAHLRRAAATCSPWYAAWGGTVTATTAMGRYSNQRMDYLVDRIRRKPMRPMRARMLTEALQLSNDTVSHIPLRLTSDSWAMKKNVELVHRADNRVDMRLVKVNWCGQGIARCFAQYPVA